MQMIMKALMTGLTILPFSVNLPVKIVESFCKEAMARMLQNQFSSITLSFHPSQMMQTQARKREWLSSSKVHIFVSTNSDSETL